jgi:CRP-like cAMP-binding protein
MDETDRERAVTLLRRIDGLSAATTRTIERLAQSGRFARLRRGGDPAWKAGSSDDQMLVVSEGTLGAVRGRQFVATFQVGTLLGISSLFGKPHTTTLVASTPHAEAFWIEASVVRRVVSTDGEAALGILGALYAQLRERDAELAEFRTRKDVAQRLALFILRRSSPTRPILFARRDELASAIGSEPATVSRLTRRWMDQDVVWKTNETIEVRDRAALEAISAG